MEHLVCHFFSSGIGAVLCQLPVLYSAARASERASARTPQHIKTSLWLLVSLALIYASRKLCCVKSARGERATRAVVGWVLSDLAAVLIKTWAQVRDRLTLSHTLTYTYPRERWAYIAAGCMPSKGCTARPTDWRPGWGAKTHTPLADSLLCCWQARTHVIGLHLRAVRMRLRLPWNTNVDFFRYLYWKQDSIFIQMAWKNSSFWQIIF